MPLRDFTLRTLASVTSVIEPLESRIAPAVLIVTNTGDSGAGSLRQALATADSTTHAAQDTIIFHLPAASSGANVIDLLSPLISLGNVNIVGPGPGKLIIDAGGAGRAFAFNDNNLAKDSPVAITGLSITNGSITGQGGAIYSLDSLTLKNVVIAGNTATNGGGIDVDGTNSSVPIKAAVSSSLISNNTASNYAGGLFLTHLGAITISNSIISGNTATNISGGGLHADVTARGTGISITGSLFSGDTAMFGAAAFLSDSAPKPSRIVVARSTISGNASTTPDTSGVGYNAGALYIAAGNALITATTVANNTSTGSCAGIQTRGLASLTIAGSTIAGNRDTSTPFPPEGAAGLYIDGSQSSTPPVTISGSIIADNSATNGDGGMFVQNGVKLLISASKVLNNHGLEAGGIDALGDNFGMVYLSVVDSLFSGNSGENFAGGIRFDSPGSTSIVGSRFIDNTTEGRGGGASINNGSSTIIRDTTFSGNISGFTGGALFFSYENFKIVGGSITGNTAQMGGGVYAFRSTTTIQETTISTNFASSKGGGIFNQPLSSADTITLKAARVTGNTALLGPNLYGKYIQGT
jgi:hypothetical protein